jgi:hypothetical protein
MWNNIETEQAAELINKEIGVNPGYFFIGDDDLIKQFDKYWREKKYKMALNLLIDIENLKDLKEYMKENYANGGGLGKIEVGDAFQPSSLPYSLIVQSINKGIAELHRTFYDLKTDSSTLGFKEFSLTVSEIQRLVDGKQWRKVNVKLQDNSQLKYANGGGVTKIKSKKRSKFAISRDKDIKAQKPGKRAANKNRETYYEYRENRTDSDLRKKLEWGGTAESSETGVPIGGENQSSMYKTGGEVDNIYNKLNKYYENYSKYPYGFYVSKIKEQPVLEVSYEGKRGKPADAEKKAKDKNLPTAPEGFEYATKIAQTRALEPFKVFSQQPYTDSEYYGSVFYPLKMKKMANGGGLTNVPESFPETDAMSYKKGGGIYSSDDRWVVTFQNQDSAEFEKVSVRANNKKNAIASAEDESGLGSDWEYYSAEKQMANGGSTKDFEYSIGGL